MQPKRGIKTWAKLHGDVMNPSGMCKDYATDWYEFWTWTGPWRR